jgi:hypothetical protein
VYTIGGGIRDRTILVHIHGVSDQLLSLLSLLLALLLFHHLLALDSGEKLMSLDVFRVVRVDALLLHLLEFLQQC